MSFADFLGEKTFIRLTVKCNKCGATGDLKKGPTCEHCGSPISLPGTEADKLLKLLQAAPGPVNPKPAFKMDIGTPIPEHYTDYTNALINLVIDTVKFILKPSRWH